MRSVANILLELSK